MDNDFNRNETWNVLPSGQTAEESRQQFKQEAEDDVIDSVFGDIFDAKEQQLSQGLIARSEANPSKYISARKTAEALGVDDVDLVYDNLDEFQQQWKEQEKAKYIKRCDNLKEMCIEDDSFLSRIDDVSAGQLARINDNIAIFGQSEAKKGFGGFIKKAKYAYNRTDREQDRNELAYDAMFADGEDKAVLEQRLAEYEDLYGDMPEIDTSGYGISDFAYAGIGQLPNQIQSVGSVAAGTLGGAAVGAGVGSVVPVLGTAAGGVAGAKIGAAAGWARAGYLIYKQEAGSMSLEMRKLKDANGNGFDDDTIKTISCLYGALSAGIEYIPASKMLNTIPGFKNITTKGLKKAIKEAVKDKTKVEILKEIGRDYIKAVAAETAEETVQQATQSSLLRYAKATANEQGMDFEQNAILDDVIEAANAGVQGFKGTALLPLGTSGARVYTDLRAYNKANEIRQLKQGKEAKAKYDAAVLDDTQKKVQEYAQSPAGEVATIKALFQKAKRSSIYRDIFMTAEDAKAVLLSEAVQKNKETLDKAGFIAEIERQIAQSAELGTPVRIGMDVYASTVMPSPELYAAFKDVVTTYADGITINEIKAKEQARANFLAEGQKRKERRKSDYELAYKTILDKMTVGGVSQEQRSKMAEFHAQLALYFTDNGQMTIGEYLQRFSADFDRSFDGAIDGGANVANVLAAVRESAANNEVANLINKSKVVAKKDINAIRKALMKQIESPNMSDVRKYIQVMNAISDMRLNIEGMSDDDIIRQLANYTKSGELKLDIERNDADRTRSGIFSASEKALSDIQADGANSDYVLVGGGRVPVNYEIVDLDDMITSHDATGAVNEAYPQELQPRDRSRSASDAQIAEIVNSFAPERVARAEIATEGAPIITKDGFVAVGNGRAMAIGQVYNHPEKVQAYQKYLTDKGYDINGVAKPVLVRRLALDLDAGQLKALVDDANTAGTMQYSDSENALRDAAKMSGNLLDLLDLDADIDSAANKRFLNGFFAEVVPTSERNAYLDKDDKITRKGVERVENAIVAKLLPDARFLSVLVENPDNNIRKVTRELAKAAPIIIALENDIAAGRISADYSLAQDVAKAVELLKRAKDKNMPVADFLQMQDMFADPIDASTQIMVRLFNNSASAAEFANKMKNYAHGAEVQGDQMQGSMFGMETLNKTQLLERELEEQRLFQGQIADSGALSIDTKEEMQGLSDEEFKAKMLEILKGLKGKKIYNTSLSGDIEIRTSSIKKYKSFFADKNKRLIVPYIPELLGKARFVSENTYTPETESNIIAYWKADLPISIDNNSFNVHLTVKQDNNGNLFWDAQVQEKAPRTDPATNPGDKGLTSEISEDAISITPSAENVNKTFYQQSLDIAQKNAELDKVNPVYEGETINIDGVERTVYNSNGERIAMSEPALRNFWGWFGDSKVVDERGRPLVVYHGTRENFDVFMGTKVRNSSLGVGFNFAANKDVAEGFGNTISVYLNIKNPIDPYANIDLVEDNYKEDFETENNEAIRNAIYKVKEILEQKGYTFYSEVDSDFLSIFERPQAQEILDGLLDIGSYIKEDYEAEALYNDIRDAEMEAFGIDGYYTRSYGATGGKVFVAFRSNQIKSTSNKGYFDPNDNRIYYQSKISDEQLEADLAEFDKILDSFADENKEYYSKKGKFEDAKKIQKKYKDFFMYNIADASISTGLHDPFYFEYDGQKDITNIWIPKKLEKNSNIILYRGAEQISIPVNKFEKSKFKKLGFKRQKLYDEGMRDVYTLNKEEKSDDVRDFARKNGKYIRKPNVYFQAAFAGSRVDYDEPSLEAIGSGEGNQAHGWGLYYALNRDVAESYRRAFLGARYDGVDWDKTVIGKYNDIIGAALLKGRKDNVLKYFTDALNKAQTRYNNLQKQDIKGMTRAERQDRKDSLENWQEKIAKYSEAVEFVKNFDINKLKTEGGQVHEVELPESPYLLDEEINVWRQSDVVKNGINLLVDKLSDEQVEQMQVGQYSIAEKREVLKSNLQSATGGKLYKTLVGILGSPQTASKMLESVGIKGITYDGNRDGRCFVIFNPKDVKVIQKFYQNQKVGMEALGAYTPLNRKITLFRNHNLSTLIHESGHYWLDMMDVFSKMPNATERLKSDYKIIKDWLGVGEDGIITDEQHEQFARGVERYFLEYHAPSSKLANIFDTFRRWLSTVYSDVRELDVELNDDVVRVFDHMLASEAEIEEYRQANQIKAMFEHADDFGMSDADFEKYKELAENSLTLAQNKHFNDKIILIHREQTEEYEKEKAKITKQTLFEWCEDKQNKAVYALFRGGKDTIGVPEIAINTKDMQEIFGDRLSELPKRNNEPIYEDNGIRFVDAAEFLGLSADQLKAAILTARQRMRNYKRELDRRVHENLGSPISYDEVEKQVVASLYNDKRANLLRMELSALSDGKRKQTVTEQAFIAYARAKLENMLVKNLDPMAYAKQAQYEGDKALIAMERGDRKTAEMHKVQQLRNFYLYKEAEIKKNEIERTLKRLKEIGRKEVNPSVDQVYQDAARALLSKVNLSRVLNSKQKERLGELAAWVMKQRENGYEIMIPDKMLYELNQTSYTELTIEDFLTLGDAVKSLIHNGRDIKEFELAGELVDREKLLAELSQQLSKFGQLKKSRSSKKSRSELAQKWMRSMDAFLTGLGHLCNRLDNGNTKGLFHKLFLRPLADAQAVERDLQEKYANKIVELTKSLSKETLANMRKYIPEAKQWLGADYTLEDLISIGLNMGNEHNLQRLKDGNGFGKEKLDWVKSYLNKEHWDYIQAIWDTLEGMYPMLEEHHKKMSGLDMDKVFPIPVKTKYGDYRGGYFPIVYDREFSPEMESKSALFDADYGRATTSKGYTKKRNQHVNAPIKLGLSNVSAHMNTVIHDVAYRGILRKLWNLNNNTEFVEMFDATIGKEYRQNINMLLKTLGNEPNRETRGLAAWESALRWTRARATMIGLGFRLTTVLAQPLGFFSSIAVMDEHKHKQKGTHNGAFWLAKAHKELMSADIREWAFANSGELRARLGNNDATISKRIKELAANAGNPTFKETAEVWAYKMLGYVDYYVATATWLAAYRQAQVDFGYEHADAAFYADRVMLNSQGTGNTKDAANIMQSNEGWRALSMFYSYFSSLYQMLVQLGRDTGSAKNMADYMNISARMLALVVIPSCIDQLMRGEYPDEEDEETWLGWLFTNSFEYMISSLPVVRDAYSTFKNGFGSSTNWSRQAGYFRTFIDGVGGMFDGEPNWQKTTKAALNSFAVISGYPTGGQIADTTSYFAGVAAGEIEPKSLADILYGIYKGKERK